MAAQLLATSMPCMRQYAAQPSRLLTSRQNLSFLPSRHCIKSRHGGIPHRSSRAYKVRAIDADEIIAEAIAEGNKLFNTLWSATSVCCVCQSVLDSNTGCSFSHPFLARCLAESEEPEFEDEDDGSGLSTQQVHSARTNLQWVHVSHATHFLCSSMTCDIGR